jgi:hypothetical protein
MPELIDYERLASELVMKFAGPRSKEVGSTPTATMGHGTNGAFAYPGLEPNITNAMVMPTFGLLSLLTSRTSEYDNPLTAIMTGVTDSSGEEPTGVCDDPPTPGLMKLCTTAYHWGRMSRMTKVYDLDRFGRYRDRSDFSDQTIYGTPFGSNSPLVPQMPAGNSFSQAIASDISKALTEFSVAWGRDFARILWNGDPANNTAGGGYKEPYGIETLINDGHRDAITGVVCPAADSVVRDFGSVEINTNGNTLLDQVSDIWYLINDNARRMGLDPAQWVIPMHPELFREIAKIWACAYSTYRCRTGLFSATQQQIVDASDTNALRDRMLNGQFLLIDGREIPVILDDTIPYTTLPGGSKLANIYFVPLRYLGSRPGIYLEYINYDGRNGAMEAAKIFAPNGSFYTTNSGRFLWHLKPPTNFCVQALAKTEWRVVLEVPQIAGRLENVKWTSSANIRNWDPDGSYYVDGGSTSRTDNSYYSPISR